MPRKTTDDTSWLERLIANLRAHTATGLTQDLLESAQTTLASHKYRYDDNKFPALAHPLTPAPADNASPASLAELLLWKLGRWKAYREFAAYYSGHETLPRNDSAVFDAFALHLKNHEASPIFDQHSLRALWAIATGLTAAEVTACRRYLLSSEERWKDTGSGKTARACFTLFKRHLDLMTVRPGVSQAEVDRVLMPLGQALKDHTTSYRDFCAICTHTYTPLPQRDHFEVSRPA